MEARKKLQDEEKVYTSTQYLLQGNLKREEVDRSAPACWEIP